MTTPNLGLTTWTAGQSQPEATVDAALDNLDRAIAGTLTHNMASDADYTLSNVTDPKEWMFAEIHITDTGVLLTTTRNIIVPTSNKFYYFNNQTAQSLVLKTSAGTGITVVTLKRAILQCDGTNVVRWTADI